MSKSILTIFQNQKIMKNIKLLFILFIGLSLISTSCQKTEEETAEEIIDQILDIHGSINLDVDGTTFDRLFSSVTYSESDKMVVFWAYDNDSEDSFIITFGEVPAVGVTGTIDYEAEDGLALLITGSFMDGAGYYAQSGTIKRVSSDEYELDVVVAEYTGTGSSYTISGTVVVGKTNP